MIFKRLIVALMAVALLMPSVVVAAPIGMFGTPAFQKMWFRFDANRGAWLNYSARSDNICRTARSNNWRDPVSSRACWEPVVMRGTLLPLPNMQVFSASGSPQFSAPIRKAKIAITNVDLAKIAYAAADAMSSPEAFMRGGLSYDARGTPADVFSDEAVRCDALGWILRKSCEVLGIHEQRDRRYAYQVSERINNAVLRRTGKTLVAINDEHGREAIACVLRKVADTLLVS